VVLLFYEKGKNKTTVSSVPKGARVNADGNGTNGIAERTRFHEKRVGVCRVHVDQ
jgi:hypothetical protein